MFKRNEGILDRIVRVGLGMVLLPAGLVLLGILHSNVLGLLAVGLGGIGLITGITGVCPTYTLFGISTLEKEKESHRQVQDNGSRLLARWTTRLWTNVWSISTIDRGNP